MISKINNQSNDLIQWSVKYRLRNGLEGCHQISLSDKDYLLKGLQNEHEPLDFFTFDSKTNRIIIQSSQLVFCNFCFDPVGNTYDDNNDGNIEEKDNSVKFFFTNNLNPLVVEVDESEPNEDSQEDGDIDAFAYELDMVAGDDKFLQLTDIDGEDIFLRASCIALVEIPLVLFPSMCREAANDNTLCSSISKK